jgi:hypothetical protein
MASQYFSRKTLERCGEPIGDERAFQVICGRMRLHGGGKGDSPPAPDYTPMAAASAESARLGKELGDAQLAENKRQYDNNMAVAAPIIAAQTAAMKSQQEQGDEYYNYQKNTFRPAEEGLVKDATDFSTAGAKESFARTAAADLEQQQANEKGQTERSMAAMGVNPNSAKFVALNKQAEIGNAAARAGAVTTARTTADNLSWAKRLDVTGLGRGLTGASQGAYAQSNQSGNSAVGNQNQTSAQYLNGIGAGNSTILRGKGLQMQGLGATLGSQTSVYNSYQPTDSSGAVIGAVGGIAAAMATNK